MCSFNSLIYPLLSGAIGAIIGTYGGVYLSNRKQEKDKKKTREYAVKGVNILLKYAKTGGTFDQAEQEFNNSISSAEKRSFLVALHKLGVPILVEPSGRFNIEHIVFAKEPIDKDGLLEIVQQIKKGLCDHLFFLDPDSYFDDNIRVRTLRELAVRWTNDVFRECIFDVNTRQVTNLSNPNWAANYSWGERIALGVFIERVCIAEFFDSIGNPINVKIDLLERDIKIGLWDNCLFWDYDAYSNLKSATNVNTQVSDMIRANSIAAQQVLPSQDSSGQ